MSGQPDLLMVSVLITTYNSAAYLSACLESVRQQTYGKWEIVIVDNASTDATRDLLAQLEPEITVLYNQTNAGFAAAQNRAMRAARGDWLLCLNPDVVLSPTFVAEVISAGELDPQVGSVSGKLLRWHPGKEPEFSRVIDSTGIYFTPSLRHLDRGAEEVDIGQYEVLQYVFGVTGAAALYRKKMVEDVSVDGEFFDEQFFSYREDADVAWRAQLMGWKCLYTPKAMGWHVRRVTPERRGQLPTEINWHSVKNRFLMRAKNISWPLYLRCFLPILLRDLQVVGYCFLGDRRLLSALVTVWSVRHDLMRRRRTIQARRRLSDSDLFDWFESRSRAFTPIAGAIRS